MKQKASNRNRGSGVTHVAVQEECIKYSNVLQISQGGKGRPYGGTGDLRDDGDANYGFKNLKGALDRLAEIPALRHDEALRDLVALLNKLQSAFATVGCVSTVVAGPPG